MNRIWQGSSAFHRKVTGITLISIALSLGVTVTLSAAFGSTPPATAFAVAVLCPAMVAAPVSWIFLRQSDRLELAKAALQDAHSRLTKAHLELEQRSMHDQMTGLVNRETFLNTLSPGNRRSDQGFLIIIDADHFKHINDTYGHQAGDRALIAIARAIASCTREGDVAARIGGEEFALFLPGASLAEAIAVSERIRHTVENLDFRSETGEAIALTVSMGGAEFVSNAALDGVLGKADRLLYEAKSAGRNRAIVAPELARVA